MGSVAKVISIMLLPLAIFTKSPLARLRQGGKQTLNGEPNKGSPTHGNEEGTIYANVDDLRSSISQLQSSNRTLESRVRDQDKEYIVLKATLQDERDTSSRTLQDMAKEIEAMRQRAESDSRLAQSHVAKVQKDKLHFEKIAADRSLEIDRLRQELSSVRVFLDETDECSGKDVIQITNDLNAKISNLASTLSDRWDSNQEISDVSEDLSRSELSDGGRVWAEEHLQFALGPSFFDIISHRASSAPDDKDTVLVAFALQTSAVFIVERTLHKFCFGLDDTSNDVILQIYESIYHKEPQGLSSRWRALAHLHSRSMIPEYHETFREGISVALSQFFSAVHLLIGRSMHADANLREDFESEFADIAETTLKLSLMIKEQTMSTNYEVEFVHPDQKFDSAIMEDVFDGEGPREHVLCTVELGLVQLLRVQTSQGGTELPIKEHLLLKPKVVSLDATLRFLKDQDQ